MLRNLENFFNGLIRSDYISGKELAKILGISQTTMIRLRKEGKAPAYVVVGKRAKYPKDAVLDWLRQHVCIDLPSVAKRGQHQESLS